MCVKMRAFKQYAAQALLPLLQWGIAARTSVSATYVSRKGCPICSIICAALVWLVPNGIASSH